MNSLPEDRPDDAMMDPKEPIPDVDGWISGPTGPMPDPDPSKRPDSKRLLVLFCREAMLAFGGEMNRTRAAELLPFWWRYGELSTEQRAVVVKLFPADPEAEPPSVTAP